MTLENGIAPSKGLHIGLWVVQVLLALLFLMAGGTKLMAPMAQLQEGMPWVRGAMGSAVRFIGVAEVLGSIGLIVPMATGIKPRLTALAAAGLAVVMLLGTMVHGERGELEMLPVTVVLGGLAFFVAWGRRSA